MASISPELKKRNSRCAEEEALVEVVPEGESARTAVAQMSTPQAFTQDLPERRIVGHADESESSSVSAIELGGAPDNSDLRQAQAKRK